MRIGITGQIGAGKSTAARFLQNMGAFLIQADEIGRQVVENNPQLQSKLAKVFGDDVIDKAGNLRRNLVAKRAFASEEAKRELDRLVHPYLLTELRARLKAATRNHDVVLVDATLIFDWGLENELDLTVVIHAPQSIRLARLKKKGTSASDALARQRQQLSLSEYRKRADVVVENRGSESDLKVKLKRLWNRRIAKAIDS